MRRANFEAAWSSAGPDSDFRYMDPSSLKDRGKPSPFRSPEGRVALVIEFEKARYTKLPFEHTPPGVVLLLRPVGIADFWQTEALVFNIEVNSCRGAVQGYLLAIQFHF